MKNKTEIMQPGIKVLALVAAFMGVVILGRMFQIGVLKNVHNTDLVEYAQQAETRGSITQARRGTIFDSQGAPIAFDTTSYSIFVVVKDDQDDSKVMKDADVTAKALAKYLDLDRDTILEKLTRPQANQVSFGSAGKNLSAETKKAIESEQLPGVYLVSEATRRYVNDVYASHLIGFATAGEKENLLDADVLEGKLGLELAYDQLLSGKDRPENGVLSGHDLYLTLDSKLQNPLEEILDRYDAQYQPETLNAYLVELNSGKLRAAAQRSTFNLNTREGIETEWKNLMVEEAYEPGSTVKILTMSVAYDQHLYQPGETYQSGSIQVYDQVVKDYNLVGWGRISFEEGLARSSNVAMVNLVNRMGSDKWVQKLAEFGFGQVTDFGLKNENPGQFKFDNPVSQVMSGFGQGFSATPIQMLQAYSAIGNHGKMVKVKVVEGIDQPDYQAQELAAPISQQAADHVLDLMVDTVEQPYGTAQSFKNPYVQVAAKTGTAQIASPDGQGYLTGENDYYHSVVTFFPADNPKYMLYLSMKRPTQTQGLLGSQILGRLFNEFIGYVVMNP